MIGGLESWGNQFLNPFHAPLEVKNRVAFLTVKVMVMPPVGAFVSAGLPRNHNGAGKTLVLKILQGTIDGGDAKRGDCLEGQSVDLIGQERPRLPCKNSLDRFSRFGRASFDAQSVRGGIGECNDVPIRMLFQPLHDGGNIMAHHRVVGIPLCVTKSVRVE